MTKLSFVSTAVVFCLFSLSTIIFWVLSPPYDRWYFNQLFLGLLFAFGFFAVILTIVTLGYRNQRNNQNEPNFTNQ